MNAPQPISVKTAALSASLALATSGTLYTKAIDISNLSTFVLSLILAGTGAVSVKAEIEESYKLPTTEGAADAAWVVANGVSDIVSNLAVKTQKHYPITPTGLRYVRFKLTELTGASADTVATAFLTGVPRFANLA